MNVMKSKVYEISNKVCKAYTHTYTHTVAALMYLQHINMSRNGKRGKLKDCLVIVELLYNHFIATEKWKMNKSFSCGKHPHMQLSTPNPFVNLVLISPCTLFLICAFGHS